MRVNELYNERLLEEAKSSFYSYELSNIKYQNDPRTRVISVDTATVGASPYGEVEGGEIIIEGPTVIAVASPLEYSLRTINIRPHIVMKPN